MLQMTLKKKKKRNVNKFKKKKVFLGRQTNLKQKKKKGGVTKHWDQSQLNQACAKGELIKGGDRGKPAASHACGNISLGKPTMTR